ncbi:Endochitinase 1 [Microsporum canis]
MENPPRPSQPNVSKLCVKWYKAQQNDNCKVIAEEKFHSFTLQQFIAWNPDVGSECTNLYAGWYYCIGISSQEPPTITTMKPTWPITTTTPNPEPRPQQPGTIRSCRAFHYVKENENCLNIEEVYGISDAEFHNWNPEVGATCLNLWAGYYVCVRA